eukprot:TRINITY_DN247_c0_g1_i1.p1 TRINITY_DN247_c0_g1~~TRINITY_DN247_c0_g1_i1.p1  ORF type:complete len:118 (-),score=8.79 TRINITY_DN247_c0_g1_i1:144-497(-)
MSTTALNPAVIPTELRTMRACMLCTLIKTYDQFVDDGCDNCGQVLGMQGDRDRTQICTTTSFEGMIGLMIPDESWVARWNNLIKFTPGCYAIGVHGNLPPDIIHELRSNGISYILRD